MVHFVAAFAEIADEALAEVGGKGANLARLARAGLPVPPGFCVTTAAFRSFMHAAELDARLGLLDALDPDDADALREAGRALREHIVGIEIAPELEHEIVAAWSALGEQHGYAVRSSATAEDLPSASFAGQQDTYLNVCGRAALLERVRACWASLFTDRAISYRARNGFDHRKVQLAVVVQRMILPEAAGVLFTADPLDGRRHVLAIDASFGLGEALVSGLVNPDSYRVDKRDFSLLARDLGDKRVAIMPIDVREGGGTRQLELPPERRRAQVLDDAQIIALARLGARLEQEFGTPLDIEWCVQDRELWLTQARPITTLFPLPRPPMRADQSPPEPDPGLRVYISFGHVQVMTDALAPFAHGVVRRFTPIARDAQGISRIACSAGGRVFMDPTDLLRVPFFAARVPKVITLIDAQIAAALREVVARPEFTSAARRVSTPAIVLGLFGFAHEIVPRVFWRMWFARTDRLLGWTREFLDAQFGELEARWRALGDPAEQLRMSVALVGSAFDRVFTRVAPSIMAAGLSGALLRKLIGERVAAEDLEALRRGVRGNVTTQMDLELGDLGDLVREHPRLEAALREGATLEQLEQLEGAAPLLAGLREFLAKYGMRGASEIDVSRPRWRDDPRLLLQVLRGNLGHRRAGAHREQHEAMMREGDAALERVIAAAPFGKRALVRRFATTHRNLVALREHPKFAIIRLFDLVHRSALAYADVLVARGELESRGDIWMLELEEVFAHIDGASLDLRARVAARRVEWSHYEKLSPPRVITSQGEIVRARIEGGDAPAGALRGTAASAGVVEGRARVVRDPNHAVLQAGEILVAPFTDPGWTPLFINAAGLVMEVGGMMTHGSVVAREYGIPAVVAVDDATKLIQTGQRLTVDGTRGWVVVHRE